jgi:hypothetical protein
MKTTQLMKRDFGGSQITQRTSDRFFNATELLSIYNQSNETQRRFKDFWENQNTQAFLNELELDILNGHNSPHLKTHETSRGRGGATWLHPYLFVKFAMWLSPKFELQIIKWVYDNLIDFRTQAGDYYKEMCDALKVYQEKNKAFEPMAYVNEANMLNMIVFGTQKALQRNEATEAQLKLMNELQIVNISLLERGADKSQRRNALLYHAQQSKLIQSAMERSKQLKS